MMGLDFSIIYEPETIELFKEGITTSLKLLVLSLALGFFASLFLGVLRNSKNKFVSNPIWLFTFIFRGTPLLVQLYLIYYGLSQFNFIRESFLWTYFSSPTFCAWFAFFLNTTAYTTEIFAGSLKASPAGEIEAGLSLGMSKFTLYRRILIPSALRRAIPSYSNEVMMMFHSTSLASVVTLVDISGAASKVYSKYYMPFEAYITAAILYALITIVIVLIFKVLEKIFLKHLMLNNR